MIQDSRVQPFQLLMDLRFSNHNIDKYNASYSMYMTQKEKVRTILYLHIRRYRYNFLCFHFLSISYKTKTLQFSELKGFSFLFIRLLWSWRESNPRPNEETIRFLHAYLRLHFRVMTRPKPPTITLASKISPRT